MTSADSVGTRPRGGLPVAALRALWSARSWRATLHALLGVPLGAGAFAVIAGLVVVWAAAVWSLADGPTGARWLAVLYVVVALAVPVALPWCVQAFGAVQRARFRAVLGVEVAAPPQGAGGGGRGAGPQPRRGGRRGRRRAPPHRTGPPRRRPAAAGLPGDE